MNEPTTYRVIQLGPPRGQNGIQRNESVADYDSLATHHPGDNRDAHMQDGVIVDGQPGRVHGFIGGEMQEIGIQANGVLLKKDFILEDPRIPSGGRGVRDVDVPSPVAGYIGLVDRVSGRVDILDREGGEVIARIRHMSPILVGEKDTVTYGQSLGTQSDVRTVGKHVHIEMGTGLHQQFENYVNDLATGRLPLEASFRNGVEPLPVVDDQVARLGETSDRVRDVQRALVADGYLATGERNIQVDGTYGRGLQGAVIAFQQDHGLLQTGDIDQATWEQAVHINQRVGPVVVPPVELPIMRGPMLDALQGVNEPNLAPGDPRFGLLPPSDPARTGRVPQWDEHADHTQQRDRSGQNIQQQVPDTQRQEERVPQQPPGDPRMQGPAGREPPERRDGPEHPPERHGPPQRQGALMLDHSSHENHAMYNALLRVVNDRDHVLGRAPDEISQQLAGGLVEKARERGLDTIGAAKFTPDGTKVGMTDTADLSAPWAKTAVGDVAQLAGQKLSQSSENVAAINQQQALEQSLKQPSQTQTMSEPEEPTPKGPRLA